MLIPAPRTADPALQGSLQLLTLQRASDATYPKQQFPPAAASRSANNGDPGRSCVSALVSAVLWTRLQRELNSCELAEPPGRTLPAALNPRGWRRPQDVAGDTLPRQGPLPLCFHSVKKLKRSARH